MIKDHFLFYRYIHHSYHVALMVLCYFLITHSQWGYSIELEEVFLVYIFPFLGYNAIKLFPYDHPISLTRKGVLFFHFFAAVFLFLRLNWFQMGMAVVTFFLTLFYTVPTPFAKKSWRSRSGFKVLIVALCWGVITVLFPFGKETSFSFAHGLYFIQRTLLVFVAVLPFEIIDMYRDDEKLGTLPQRIGIALTKKIGYFLLLVAVLIQLALSFLISLAMWPEFIIAIIYGFALLKSTPTRNSLYTLFWVEAIPLVGLLILSIFKA